MLTSCNFFGKRQDLQQAVNNVPSMDGSFNILIVDSHRRGRSQLRGYLSVEPHYNIYEAATASEVLKAAQDRKLDLILLDSKLPQMSGYELARKLKSSPTGRLSRIFILAPQKERDKRLLAIESGADEMFIKPIDKTEFLIRIDSALRVKFFYDQFLLEREKAEKLKEDFLAIITHDLKTPLAAIIGNIQLLRKELEDDQKHATTLQVVDIASRNLLLLINNLLNMMRMDSGMMTLVPEDFRFEVLAKEVVAMVQPFAQRMSIHLVLQLCAAWVHADMDKIRQVLSNLLSNAIKFTPRNGTVTLQCSENGKKVVVSVADTGSGISEEDRATVFQKFSQRPMQKGGTGLGLYIVNKLLELHGTSIQLESTPGKGSVFSFALEKASPGNAALHA